MSLFWGLGVMRFVYSHYKCVIELVDNAFANKINETCVCTCKVILVREYIM